MDSRVTLPPFRKLLPALFFAILWAYVIVRACTVFYAHDEIATKWGYMVSWNPLPYQGFIDANNHFLNSFLGGLFIRMSGSDAPWIVRLPNILAFPLFFWSLYSLRTFFRSRIIAVLLLVLITCSSFIIEFFSMARGYGISLALLAFAMQQMMAYAREGQSRCLLWSLAAWTLSVYANLTLIPFAAAGAAALSLIAWRKKQRKWAAVALLSLIPWAYAVQYSFYLRDAGMLYHGGQEGFFAVTLHSLTHFLWNIVHPALDVALMALTAIILFTLTLQVRRATAASIHRLAFPLFLALGIAGILGQHYLLGVNFPEDRSALWLVVFFFGALCFSLDHLNVRWPAYPAMAMTLALFFSGCNFNRSVLFHYEHFDRELLTAIPDRVSGTPPSTGGRFWMMDNELTRMLGLPLRAFQEAVTAADTLQDFIIITETLRPDITQRYHAIHTDEISGLTLYRRDRFLPRKKVRETKHSVNGKQMYFDFYAGNSIVPVFIRCTGRLEDMNIYKYAGVIFTVEDTVNGDLALFSAVSLTQTAAIAPDGSLDFDFTFALHGYPPNHRLKVFLYNEFGVPLRGGVTMSVYDIAAEGPPYSR